MTDYKKYRYRETGEIVCAEKVYTQDGVDDKILEEVYLVTRGDLSLEEYKEYRIEGKNEIIECKLFDNNFLCNQQNSKYESDQPRNIEKISRNWV